MASLRADVYVAPGIPFSATQDMPGHITAVWSPMGITLISGHKEAVLVDASDCVYNNVHQFLGETNSAQGRDAWTSVIRNIAALHPHTVVAGHERPGAVDGANNLAATMQYTEDLGKYLDGAESAEQLFEHMARAYPNRVSPYALWLSCSLAFKG